jgi:DNA-binding transcriptional LysR family regulator
MKLRWLEIFHAVVSTGSVSEAARSLAITQPTATRLLRDFEASVEAPLFNRVKGRLVPTTAARRLAEETRGLFEAVADFEMAAGDVRHEPAPDLRVFANEELARCVMPATLAEVMVRRSDMVFETHRRHEPSAIAEALLTGPSSIAFAF